MTTTIGTHFRFIPEVLFEIYAVMLVKLTCLFDFPGLVEHKMHPLHVISAHLVELEVEDVISILLQVYTEKEMAN